MQPTISLSVTKDQYTWYAYRHPPKETGDTSTYADIAVRKLFVIGDSHTAAYRTMLEAISVQLGFEVFEYEQGGCAVAGLLKPMNRMNDCQEFYEHTLTEVKNTANPGDIIFFASLRMPELSDQFEIIDEMAAVTEFNSEAAS